MFGGVEPHLHDLGVGKGDRPLVEYLGGVGVVRVAGGDDTIGAGGAIRTDVSEPVVFGQDSGVAGSGVNECRIRRQGRQTSVHTAVIH